MNGYVIAGISGVVGAAAGAVGAYIFCKKRFDAMLDEEVRRFKDSYKPHKPYFEELAAGEVNVVRSDESSSDSSGASERSGSEEHVDLRQKSSLDMQKRPMTQKEYKSYHKLASNYRKDALEDLAGSETPSEDGNEESTRNDIFVITAEEYEELTDNDDFGLVGLIWYVNDDILLDVMEEEVENQGLLVGDCLDNLREELLASDHAEGGNTIFVQNNTLHTLYDVELVFEPYQPAE